MDRAMEFNFGKCEVMHFWRMNEAENNTMNGRTLGALKAAAHVLKKVNGYLLSLVRTKCNRDVMVPNV